MHSRLRTTVALALVTLLPCVGGAQGTAAPASTQPPTLAAPTSLRLPTMVERTLPNGLRLVIVEHLL